MVSVLDLPSEISDDQLKFLKQYVKEQEKLKKKSQYGSQNYYQDKKELMGKKLIIFRHKQKKKDVFYMRLYLGSKKYKTTSLRKHLSSFV